MDWTLSKLSRNLPQPKRTKDPQQRMSRATKICRLDTMIIRIMLLTLVFTLFCLLECLKLRAKLQNKCLRIVIKIWK